MKHVSSSASQITTQTLSAYREVNKNAEKAQTGSTANGTSLNRSDVTVSQQAYSQAKFDSYETMDRNALKKRGIELLDQLFIAGSKKANAEVPNSDDPVRLARAKQATAFVCGQSGTNFKSSAPNPFFGMSREQLTKIMYDDSGAYTINERAAAGSEQQRQDYNYWSPIISDSFMKGDNRRHYQAAIEFYDKLSTIEKSFAPVGYRENVVNWLKKEEVRLGKLGDLNIEPSLNDITKNSLDLSSQEFFGSVGAYGWMNIISQVERSAKKHVFVPFIESGVKPKDSIFRVTWNSINQPIKKFFQ